VSTAPKAPYVAGDKVKVLHYVPTAGTCLGTFTVDRVTALDGDRWRLSMIVSDGSVHEVTVERDGRDRHGYVERAT
jgi:peroxiredoxin